MMPKARKKKKVAKKKTAPELAITAAEAVDGPKPGDTKCEDGREWIFTIDMGWQLTGNAC